MHPENQKILDEVNRQIAEQNGDNIVPMAEKVMEAGDLERRRLAMQRATQIICGRLQSDAEGMEEAAVSERATGNITKYHQLTDSARCLRVAVSWLTNATEDAPNAS